jgi:hypothetical protein
MSGSSVDGTPTPLPPFHAINTLNIPKISGESDRSASRTDFRMWSVAIDTRNHVIIYEGVTKNFQIVSITKYTLTKKTLDEKQRKGLWRQNSLTK